MEFEGDTLFFGWSSVLNPIKDGRKKASPTVFPPLTKVLALKAF